MMFNEGEGLMNTFNNARFKGTEKNLEETLIELTTKKTVPEITVMELCQVAEINRSTFYAHYENIPDMGHKLLNAKFLELNALFATQLKKSTASQLKKDLNTNVGSLLGVIKNNKKLCLAFLSINSELSVYDKAFELITKSIGISKATTKSAESKYNDAITHFIFYTILTTYIRNNCKDKTESIVDLMVKQLNR